MKLPGATALLLALCHTATATVQVVLPTTNDNDAQPTTLDPITARLVLAQRLGVEDFHSADLKSSSAIAAINTFGRRIPLFGSSAPPKNTLALFVVEGEAPLSPKGQVFAIVPSPSTSAIRDLWQDLLFQVDPVSLGELDGNDPVDDSTHINTENWSMFQTQEQLDTHLALHPEARESAIIIYSSNSSDHRVESWGTYEMPGAQSPLRKRARPTEAPLELESMAPFRQSANSPVSAAAAKNSSSKAVVGILPACFSSESLCQSMTRNCSGHGRCYHKFTDKTAAKTSPARECYACQCAAQVTENEQGQTVTTRWGGPACQKKDISTQFWLLALFTVGLVFVVMFAIGQIMDMGGQELPSVIGAGVSGPVKRS